MSPDQALMVEPPPASSSRLLDCPLAPTLRRLKTRRLSDAVDNAATDPDSTADSVPSCSFPHRDQGPAPEPIGMAILVHG